MVREPAGLIRAEVAAVRRAGRTQFGVNLIPAAAPPDLLEKQIATVIELRVSVVCLFWNVGTAIMQRLRNAVITAVTRDADR